MFFVSICSYFSPVHWSHVLSRERRCSWSSADGRCFNYIWVINKCIACSGAASYIRDMTTYEDFNRASANSWFERGCTLLDFVWEDFDSAKHIILLILEYCDVRGNVLNVLNQLSGYLSDKEQFIECVYHKHLHSKTHTLSRQIQFVSSSISTIYYVTKNDIFYIKHINSPHPNL